MMDVIKLREQKSALLDKVPQTGLWIGGAKVWAKPAGPLPISTYYGIGAGQIPMDHKYAEGTVVAGKLTSVPNLGGAGSVFNLTTNGSAAISGNAVDLDPSVYFSVASQADLIGTRLFIVADIRSVVNNQYFAGQNENNSSGGKVNLILSAGGAQIRATKNVGTTINADVALNPIVSPTIRLYEIEMISGGAMSVWINGQLRGTTTNPHTSYLINRIAAGQSITSGLNALMYRSLSLITGGDFAARVNAIRARLNQEYGLGM